MLVEVHVLKQTAPFHQYKTWEMNGSLAWAVCMGTLKKWEKRKEIRSTLPNWEGRSRNRRDFGSLRDEFR